MPRLETMEPDPVFDPEARAETVAAFEAVTDDLTVKIWGGDWCVDCRRQLPGFAAALRAAGVPEAQVEHYPVEKEADGSKTGPRVEEYGVERIPTIVLERDGEEVARFVEEESAPPAIYLADCLREVGVVADAER
jgi:thiol-disulfide isomerase/thioredoxin